MAYGIGRLAWRNRRVIGRGIKRISRTVRSRRAKRARFSASNIGEPVGSATAKQCRTGQRDHQVISTRTLYNEGLFDIGRGDERYQRERDIINVRGVKICMEFSNRSTNPMYFHWAIIHPKDGKSGIGAPDFFRNQANGGQRGAAFANSLSAEQFHCLPINTDIYTIIRHRKMVLGPAVGSTVFSARNTKNYGNVSEYIPIKRQVRYVGPGAANPASGQLWLVFWCDRFGEAKDSVPIPNEMFIGHHSLVYFHEPKA